MNWPALRLSIQVTLAATAVILVVGLALARFLARREFPGKAALETVLLLPLVLPPSVLGFYLLVILGAEGPLGRLTGLNLLFTWHAAAVASATVGLPLMIQASKAAIASVDPALENAARVLGATEARVFLRVTLPLARRGVLAGLVLGAARAFGEFGATLMVAGSIPGRTQTLPLAIFDAVQVGDYGAVHAMVALTTVMALASLWVVHRLTRSPSALPRTAEAR